jgi:hypothetical protein
MPESETRGGVSMGSRKRIEISKDLLTYNFDYISNCLWNLGRRKSRYKVNRQKIVLYHTNNF